MPAIEPTRIFEFRGAWAAVGDGWMIIAPSREEALRRFRAAASAAAAGPESAPVEEEHEAHHQEPPTR